MNRAHHSTGIFLILLILFMLSCGPTVPVISTLAISSDDGSDSPATDAATEAPAPESIPTALPTATVYPPVWNADTLGDARELDGFVLTYKETEAGSGVLEEHVNTINY